jgi:hypothetical protein
MCVMVANVLDSEVVVDASLDPQGNAVPPAELLTKLPPSGRDFEVFEHVVVDGGTTRSAAYQFQISQTRVCQVLERVRNWMDEVTPAEEGDDRATKRRLQLAVGIAGDRLDHLYGQAMVGWRSSEGEVERVRVSPTGVGVKTRAISYGDTRYLMAAGRLALLRSKLATLGVCNRAAAIAADLVEGPLEDDALASPTSDHPVRECSGNAECGVRKAELGAEDQPVTHAPERTYDPLTREQAAARRAFFGPVQEPESSVPRHGNRGHRGQKESAVAGVLK